MRILMRTLSAALLALGLWVGGAEAADRIRVVTTTTDLKALTGSRRQPGMNFGLATRTRMISVRPSRW
jgi:hypothetical protein